MYFGSGLKGFFCFGAFGLGLDSNFRKVREAQEAGETFCRGGTGFSFATKTLHRKP